ncbi:MAG TPA: glycosyltransferase family 2 protein [Allosphingosinicella sp.]|nr:glycosyltransferase family 2 protein [Allosphingosinicella sp.]
MSIVMPCLNEAGCLPVCIANAREALAMIRERHGLEGEIVIADNGSTDGSQEIAARLGARVAPVAERGYGAALIGGGIAAQGRYIIFGDADGSYDFREAVAMVGTLVDGADMCMGSRFQGGIARGAMPWKNRYIGNPALTGLLNLFFRSGIDDAHCGLRAITRDAFLALRLNSGGMEFASEMVIKASLRKFRIAEVPATLSPDLRDRPPHLRPWRDGWRHLRYLLMLSPTWTFGVPGLAAIGLGLTVLAVALLHFFGLFAGPGPFGASWTIVAGFLVTCGHFAAIMALAMHLHGVREGYRLLRPSVRRIAPLLNLETMLSVGLVLIAASILGFAAIGWRWSADNFASLPSVLPLVLTAVAGAVGLQTVLGGFAMAILSGHAPRFVREDRGSARQEGAEAPTA